MGELPKEYESSSYIQTLVSGKKRVVTEVFEITKKLIDKFWNDLEEA